VVFGGKYVVPPCPAGLKDSGGPKGPEGPRDPRGSNPGDPRGPTLGPGPSSAARPNLNPARYPFSSAT